MRYTRIGWLNWLRKYKGVKINCLITKTGKIVECVHGQTHEQVCKFTLKTTLKRFLHSGVRVKMYRSEMIFESTGKPIKKQIAIMNGILRKNDVFELMTDFDNNYNIRKSFARPIRRIAI